MFSKFEQSINLHGKRDSFSYSVWKNPYMLGLVPFAEILFLPFTILFWATGKEKRAEILHTVVFPTAEFLNRILLNRIRPNSCQGKNKWRIFWRCVKILRAQFFSSRKVERAKILQASQIPSGSFRSRILSKSAQWLPSYKKSALLDLLSVSASVQPKLLKQLRLK